MFFYTHKLNNALDDKNAFEKLDGYRMLIEQDVFGGFNKMIIQESPSGKLIVLSILNRGRYGRDVDENLIVNGLKPVLSVF